MVAKKMGRNENPVVVVVSPLVALMEDKVKEATLIILLLPSCMVQLSSVDNYAMQLCS